jgi:hypothetical protein
MESRRLAPLLVLVLIALAALAAGCGGGQVTGLDVASFMRKTQPSAFADISCVPNRASGWDYVCTYTDPELGREQIGVVVRGKRFMGSGSAPLGELPDGPNRKNTDAEYGRRAGAICAKRAAAVSALPRARNQYDVLDRGERVKQLEAIEESRLVGVNPPDDERDAVRAFLQSLDPLQRRMETFRDALTRRDAADVLRAETELRTARHHSTALAAKLGLSCRY